MKNMPVFANLYVHSTQLVDVVIYNADNEPIKQVNEVSADESAELVACLPPHSVHFQFGPELAL